MKRFAPLALVAALSVSQAGCYGSYGAFRTVHKWNGHATSNKYVNSTIHLGLWIVPVYQIVGAADFLLFNNIEFFTGKPVFSNAQ